MKRIFLIFFSLVLILLPVGSSAQTSGDEIVISSPVIVDELNITEPPSSSEGISTSTPVELIENNEEVVNATNTDEIVIVQGNTAVVDVPADLPDESTSSEATDQLPEVFALTSNSISLETPESSLLPAHCGDIDQNRVVDATDLALAQNYIFEGGEALPGANYDLNNDGVPNVLDIVTLVNYTRRHMLPEECVLDTSNGNQAPSFGNFNPATSTFVGDIYAYDVEATDPEGESLVFSLLSGPDGMVISSSTGEIAWTPDASAATSTPYLITIQVSDGTNDLSESFDLLVSLKSNAFMCGDLNGDGLINQIDIDFMADIAFEGTVPHPLANPDLNGDDIWNAIDVVTIVNHVNRGYPAPTCGAANHLPEIQAPSFASTTLGRTLGFEVVITDADNDPLVISTSFPASSTYSTSTGFFRWTPTSVGTSTATWVVNDGHGTSTHSVLLEVFVLPVPANSCGDVDRDGDIDQADIDKLTEYIFEGLPIPYLGLVDMNGDSVPNVVDVVYLVNYVKRGGPAPTCGASQAPSFSNFNPPTTAVATQNYSYDAEASDPEGDPLVFSVVSGPTGLTINSSTGMISWTPTEDQATSTPYSVTIRVSDGTSNTDATFSITVSPKPVTPPSGGGGGGGTTVILTGGGGGGAVISGGGGNNLPPIFVNFNPKNEVNVGEVYLYDTEATDPDNDPITFSLTEYPVGMLMGYQNGIIFWVPTQTDGGKEFQITVEASDGRNVTKVTYKLRVNNPIAPIAPSSPSEEEVEIIPSPSTPEIGSPEVENPISNETSTAAGSTDTDEGTPFGRFLAGLLTQFSGWQLWLLGILFLLLLLWIFFLIFWKRRKEEEKNETGAVTGAVEAVSGEAIFLGGEASTTNSSNTA